MTPDEVCEALVKIGADVSRRTLLNYEEAGLIPTPIRGSSGRSKGRFTDYPPKTIEETFAAWQHLSPDLPVSVSQDICCAEEF